MVSDLVILGGGPAGVAAALSFRKLRPQARLVILEASSQDQWQPGETLPAGCRPILESLGCWEHFCASSFTVAHGTRAAWGGEVPYENDFLYSAHGSGWHLDRRRFDSMLRKCAQEVGVELLRGARLAEAQKSESGWNLVFRHGDRRVELTAAFVIDAAGRGAVFSRQQGARIVPGDRLAGVVGIFERQDGIPQTQVEAQADGWWYSVGIPGFRLVVAWMSDTDLIRTQSMCDPTRWTDHLRRSCLTAARFGDTRLEAPLRVLAAHSQRLEPAAGSGWTAAGDAASTCDPLASQGILRALRTGKLASFVAVDSLEGRTESTRKYDRMIAAEYTAYCRTKEWYYGLERRWPDSAFWLRRRHRILGQAA